MTDDEGRRPIECVKVFERQRAHRNLMARDRKATVFSFRTCITDMHAEKNHRPRGTRTAENQAFLRCCFLFCIFPPFLHTMRALSSLEFTIDWYRKWNILKSIERFLKSSHLVSKTLSTKPLSIPIGKRVFTPRKFSIQLFSISSLPNEPHLLFPPDN